MGEQGKGRAIGYWIATGLVAFVIGAGGLADVVGPADVIATFARLGYPEYFPTILGLWKVGGAIAILLPRTALLKEWAYAGIVFDLTGAAASHVFVGDPAANVAVPVVVLGLTAASWLLRPPSRRLRT